MRTVLKLGGFLMIFLASSFIFAQAAWAQASLYVAPASGAYKSGELFSVLVNVNTGSAAINAASGQINFDNARLEVVSLGYSRSIFTIWTEEPNYSNAAGVVKFSGGLPSPGFTGASGAIMRITFRPKSFGQAPVVFVSGSVLANDGEGTNILDGLNGGVYNILSAIPKTPEELRSEPEETPAKPSGEGDGFVTSDKPIEAPRITDWPRELEAGQSLMIRGLGLPLTKVLVTIQKGSDDPIRGETFSGIDGRFSFTYAKAVSSGFYRIWARNVTNEGLISATSETVSVEVVAPLFFRIGTVALNYASIIVTLLALLFLAGFLLIFSWIRFRQWRRAQGIELTEAEEALHHGFDRLKTGLTRYLAYLTEAGSASGAKRREAKTRKDLQEELESIERKIEKEIGDINIKNKNKRKNE